MQVVKTPSFYPKLTFLIIGTRDYWCWFSNTSRPNKWHLVQICWKQIYTSRSQRTDIQELIYYYFSGSFFPFHDYRCLSQRKIVKFVHHFSGFPKQVNFIWFSQLFFGHFHQTKGARRLNRTWEKRLKHQLWSSWTSI